MSAIDRNIKSGTVVTENGFYFEHRAFENLVKSVEAAIAQFHEEEPLASGLSRAVLRERAFAYLPSEIFQAVITRLGTVGAVVLDKQSIRLSSHQRKFSVTETAIYDKIFAKYVSAGLEVKKLSDVMAESVEGTTFTTQDARKFFQIFLDSGEIVKVTEDLYFAKVAIDNLIDNVGKFAASTSDRLIDVAAFKEIAGVSRKYAIPLMEYFDRERVTIRIGEKRKIL